MTNQPADVVVEFVTDGGSLPEAAGSALFADLAAASSGSTMLWHNDAQRRLFVKVSGDKPKLADFRSAASAAVSAATKLKAVKTVEFNLSGDRIAADAKQAVVQAALLTNYHFDPYLAADVKEKRARTFPALVCLCEAKDCGCVGQRGCFFRVRLRF